MNVADSQRLESAFEKLGLDSTARAADADVIVLNTCVVRQSAEDKAYARLMSLKPLKQARPELVLGLMGCLVGVRDASPLQTRFPFVDVATDTPQRESILITVLLPVKGTGRAGTLQLKREGDTYVAQIGNALHTAEVRVFDRGENPEFEVR